MIASPKSGFAYRGLVLQRNPRPCLSRVAQAKAVSGGRRSLC